MIEKAFFMCAWLGAERHGGASLLVLVRRSWPRLRFKEARLTRKRVFYTRIYRLEILGHQFESRTF